MGSFINVVIYRLPKNKSIISPRSFCPNCKKTIPIYRNIPVLTYILQSGKCHHCKTKIPNQYPLVEILIGLIWYIPSLYFTNSTEIIYFSTISTILISIAFIDYKHFIIPIELSLFSILFIIPYIFYFERALVFDHFLSMLVGAGYLSFVLLLLFILTKKQTLGFGDIQLLLVLGLWIGNVFKIILVTFLGSLFALVAWIVLSVLDKKFNRNRKLPFGTYLSLTAILIQYINLLPNNKINILIDSFGQYLSLPFK